MSLPDYSRLKEYTLDLACRIQQIPAPTFEEKERGEFIREEMLRLGLKDVYRDSAGNVLGCWPGGKGKPLVISAHLDTVHAGKQNLPLERVGGRIQGPGIGDNSIGLAAMLAVGKWLVESDQSLAGNIWLAADVCEEGLGNLSGMKSLVDHFAEDALAYIVLEGLGLGQICHRGLGVIRYRISAETGGGHAWVNYGAASAIHELAKLVATLADISLPNKPRTSLNVGKIQGGLSVNTIASQASCELDLRSEDQLYLSRLAARVRKIIQSRERPQVHFSVDSIGSRPAGGLSATHPLVRLASDCLARLRILPTLEVGSTDANIPLSRGFPSICIAVTRGGCPHTEREFIETEPIGSGLEQLLTLIPRAWEITEG